jgi:hypothetical protein
MKKTEKILLIGGAVVGGLVLLNYVKNRPPVNNAYAYRGLPAYNPATGLPYGTSSTASDIQAGAAAASSLAPVLENLFDNIFGSSNSGSTSAVNSDSIPDTGMGGDVLSGIGCVECAGGVM